MKLQSQRHVDRDFCFFGRIWGERVFKLLKRKGLCDDFFFCFATEKRTLWLAIVHAGEEAVRQTGARRSQNPWRLKSLGI